ncbi:MAG TPA: DUF4446 family protein [Actinomycetota bacterium]|nr:DUF4446 family protein [Actinomycetota bacterium]
MPNLTTEQLTLVVAVVAAVALIALLSAVALALRLRKLHRDFAVLRGDGAEVDVLAALSRSAGLLDAVDRRVDEVVAAQSQAEARGRFAIQKFGLVRYDAFEDMGGRLSFSAALLDDHGDGVIITSINGRTETRTYAKPIKALSSEHNLSEEERQAIAGAVSGSDRSHERALVSD